MMENAFFFELCISPILINSLLKSYVLEMVCWIMCDLDMDEDDVIELSCSPDPSLFCYSMQI